MMSTRVIAFSIGLLLACLAVSEGTSVISQEEEPRCRCILTESKPIGRHIERLEIIPANSHCDHIQIIATLKKTGQEVCLNPEAPSVQKLSQRIMANRRH